MSPMLLRDRSQANVSPSFSSAVFVAAHRHELSTFVLSLIPAYQRLSNGPTDLSIKLEKMQIGKMPRVKF